MNFFGKTPRELKAAVEALGYRNHWVDGQRLVPVRADDFQAETVVDYLALKIVPKSLRERIASKGRSMAELVSAALVMCTSPEVAHRSSIARAIADAPSSISGDARIVEAVKTLRGDPEGAVRDAAGVGLPMTWLGRIARRIARSA